MARPAMARPIRLTASRLAVSPAIYRLSWWLIFCMHLLNGALVFVTGANYLFFSRDETYGNVALLQIPQSTLQLSGWSYLVLATVHGDALYGLVAWSVRAGQLILRQAHNSATKRRIQPTGGAQAKPRHWWDPRTWRAAVKETYSSWFGVDGSYGFNGEHFYRWFLVREVIEVGLQTYQANQISRSVARASINALAATVLILNCISTPLAVYMFRKRGIVSRLVSLLAGMILDFSSSTVLPLAVVYPYIAAYDASLGTLPLQLTLEDAWLVGAIEVIRQSAVTSLVDYFAYLMPHVSVISCLSIAKSVIHRDLKAYRRLSMQLMDVSIPSQATIYRALPAPTNPRVFVHTILSLAWTGFILVAHLVSQHHTDQADNGCRLLVYESNRMRSGPDQLLS